MRAILEALSSWLDVGESIALATVVWTEGSSPRPLGSRMAVTDSGKMVGSVSGGCVEGDVFQEARRVLAEREARRLHYGAVEQGGWQVGLACGGKIDVYVEPLVDIHRLLVQALQRDETVGLATRLDGEGHLLAWADGRLRGDRSLAPQLTSFVGASEFPSLNAELTRYAEGEVFLEVFARPSTLTIIGAVHIAQPLVAMAQLLGFHVRLIDARRTFATRERFPDVDELVIAWPQDGLVPETLRPRDAVVILTHDPKFDVPALEAVLRSPVGYVGLLGSTATQEKRQKALRELGFGEQDLTRIHGPVGLDIGGRRPEEIALAIMAQIVAVHNE